MRTIMQRWLTGAIALSVLALGGCSAVTWNVTMTPSEHGFKRSTVVINAPKKQPPVESVVTDKTPQDVGGAGRCQRWSDSLGSASVYLERFRGDDDAAAQLAAIGRIADQLDSLAAGWFEHELGKEPGWPKLKTFIDGDLRSDLHNIGVYLWLGRSADASAQQTLSRVALYLIERGYFEPAQLPRLSAALRNSAIDHRAVAELMQHLQRLVARHMGVGDDEPIPASLDFLATPDKFVASFTSWYHTTPQYQQELAKWRAKHPNDDEDEMYLALRDPKSDATLGDAMGLAIFAEEHDVKLTIESTTKPLHTNGAFDADQSTLIWTHQMNQKLTAPAVFYAVWATPNAATQQQHLGRVALRGDALMNYQLWRASLDADLQKQWDDFIASLTPGDDMAAKLDAFAFTRDGHSLGGSIEGVSIIKGALGIKK